MLDYIIRRVLFIIPTLLGIMFLNFLLVQFVPGGPVEQMIYQFENGSNLDLVGGGGSDAGQENNSNQSLSNDSKYKIPSILIKYRKDINPIRALKFELQEIMAMYTVDDDYHLWLIKEFKREDKIKEIIFAVKNDIIKIVEMQKKFKRAKKKYSYFVLPMSYYHCIEMEADMVSWIKTLQEFLVWSTQDDIKKRYD